MKYIYTFILYGSNIMFTVGLNAKNWEYLVPFMLNEEI